MRHAHRAILCSQVGDGGRRGGHFAHFVHRGRSVVVGQGMGVEAVQFVRVGSVDGGGAGVGGPPPQPFHDIEG